MGEALVRNRAKGFVPQQDEAFLAELKTKSLFSDRPEVFDTHYPGRLVDPAWSVGLGTEVLLRSGTDAAQADCVEVVSGNQVAAVIGDEPGSVLREIMASDPRCGGVIVARVVTESPLDGSISVRCIVEGRPHEES